MPIPVTSLLIEPTWKSVSAVTGAVPEASRRPWVLAATSSPSASTATLTPGTPAAARSSPAWPPVSSPARTDGAGPACGTDSAAAASSMAPATADSRSSR